MSGGKQSLIKAEKFSDQAFDAISFYGIACLFSYGNSQPFYPLGIGASYDCIVFGAAPHPLIIYSPKSTSFSDPFQLPVRFFFHAYRPTIYLMLKYRKLYGQTFSSFGSAAAQYLTA